MRRKRMGKGRSRRSFRRGFKMNRKNSTRAHVMRGGTRL